MGRILAISVNGDQNGKNGGKRVSKSIFLVLGSKKSQKFIPILFFCQREGLEYAILLYSNFVVMQFFVYWGLENTILLYRG